MRFYMRRCSPDYRSHAEQTELEGLRGDMCGDHATAAERGRYDALRTSVSNKIEIIDGDGSVQAFVVHENDADTVCAYLNIGDRQDKLCAV